ncbi:uncharacterized protein LOC133182822 [Saccostrea echinata]|uniref:uncharacterized protein LOC133182822 n=1 Tax=Saccostrea echinata TaxID=191078 RepID=UPI002A800AD6|nr:uncharacterized protein LOC133182822 [Saccostrea echinata]
MEIIFILFSSLGWSAVCNSEELWHTECLSQELLGRKKHNIACASNKKIYITTQFIKYEDRSHHQKDEEQCQNSTSAECFRSFPLEKRVDFTLYFNVSQICNRANKCDLTPRDYYKSVIEFTKSCKCCTDRTKFPRIRFILYFECLSGAEYNVDLLRNLTGKKEGSLYLASTKSNKCSINGQIESARILEDLPCVKGLASIILDIETSAELGSKILWMEIKGRSLQLLCGDSIEDVQLESKHFETEEPEESLSIPIIIGPFVGALLVVAVILFIFKR